MKIKTATRIAIYGTIIAALMGMARPYVVDVLVKGLKEPDAILFFNAYNIASIAVGSGGLLVFLLTLASKQKD